MTYITNKTEKSKTALKFLSVAALSLLLSACGTAERISNSQKPPRLSRSAIRSKKLTGFGRRSLPAAAKKVVAAG